MDIIYGGPIMGHTVTNPEEPIQAGTAAVLFQPKQQAQERPCIQCGDCNPICPEALQPQALLQFIQAKQVQQHNSIANQGLENLNLNDCIRCGACDLVCPSFIPLTSLFKSEQKNLQDIHKRHAAAQRAKLNYEARQARLAKPARANPPMPIQTSTVKPRIKTGGANPATRLKTQLAKAQRLYRESAAALEQAKKKQLDEATLAQYQDRVNQMQQKAEAAQKALNGI
jgi:electron transport complex protein RnfC